MNALRMDMTVSFWDDFLANPNIPAVALIITAIIVVLAAVIFLAKRHKAAGEEKGEIESETAKNNSKER